MDGRISVSVFYRDDGLILIEHGLKSTNIVIIRNHELVTTTK